ncbi:MAG: hypothetical protein GY739_19145 [Mesoflavibacter sp.]|nr:hypothetical protein [Mesoflavibacter sp.]
MDSTSVSDVQKMTELDLHMPEMALPVQTKLNKAVLGRISSSSYPIGARGGEGVSEYQIAMSNSLSAVISNTDICLDLDVEQVGTTVRTGSNKFRGSQVLFKSVNVNLGSHKLCDIPNFADRVADFHVQSTHTSDEMDYLEAMAGVNADAGIGAAKKTLTLRLPLKWFGLDFGNLLPTGAITSQLRINLTVNDKVNNMFTGLTAGSNEITIRNLRLETEFIELQNTVNSKRLELIKSSSGLTIPYHAYSCDVRSLQQTSQLNERISLNYNNVVSVFQLPYNSATNGPNANVGYYDNIKWNNIDKMNDITGFLVQFSGGTFFNLNSTNGQSGKASHAKALMETLRTENTAAGAGSRIVKGIDNYQVLCANFVRANNVLSPAIIDSGINSRVLDGLLSVNAVFKTQVPTGKQLTTITKYTQRIVFKSSGMDVYS